MKTVSKMGPTIVVGLLIAQGSKAKPTSQASTTLSEQSEGWSDTNGGQQMAHLEPHRGDPTSLSLISESRLGGFLHAPPCGLASSRPSFSARDYLGKSHETT
jgi:hypothetical protein